MVIFRRSDVEHLAQFVVKELQKELIAQKHVASGSLHDSVSYQIKSGNIEIYAEEHGIFVDQGRKAGGKKVPVLALLDWVIKKGLDTGDRTALSVAYAIQTKIYREGIPTVGSRRIANKRLHWIEQTMIDLEPTILSMLETAALNGAQAYLDKVMTRNQNKLAA